MNRSQGLMSYSEIRATARKLLKGSWSKFFLLMMIFVVASNFFSLNSLSGYVMNNSASDETASIMVVHTSGLSWDGEIPSPEVSERSVYSLEEFLLGTTSVRSYSLKDFIRTIATGGFVGLLECLPSDFWIVLFVLSLATLLLPMMNYGLAVNYRRRMQGDVPQASALFRWKMLPRCVIADVILFGPVFLLRPLAEESSIYTTILILYYAAILFFGILEYVWSMRYYIWAESPDKGIIAVLRESRLRMRGHKFRLFALRLTFIGWIMLYSFGSSAINLIVSALGLPGIISTALNLCGYIWLNVYQQMSEMVFFDNLCHPGTIVTDGEEDDIPAAKNSSIHIRSSNESVAWSILSSHKYSHQAIKNEGIWEEYQALGIDPSVEIEWLKMYRHIPMR